MSTQLEAITCKPSSHRTNGFCQSMRPKVRRYFERKPGWVANEIREMQRHMTDWEFLAKYGYGVPTWQRPPEA